MTGFRLFHRRGVATFLLLWNGRGRIRLDFAMVWNYLQRVSPYQRGLLHPQMLTIRME